MAAATWPKYVGAIAAAVAAIGTVAAVCVALFFQPLRERRRKPRISLETPSVGTFGVPAADPQFLYPITMPVKAERGRDSAEEVEILATVSWNSRERPHEASHVQFESRPLLWYESDETDGNLLRMHMAPGMFRRVEILKVGSPHALYRWLGWSTAFDPASYYPGETAAFSIPPKPRTIGSRPLVQEYLDWHVRFDVTARNVDTVTYEADLRVQATWVSDVDGAETQRPDTWEEANAARVETKIEWLDFREVSR